MLEGQVHGGGGGGPRPDTALVRRASEVLAEAEGMGIQTAQHAPHPVHRRPALRVRQAPHALRRLSGRRFSVPFILRSRHGSSYLAWSARIAESSSKSRLRSAIQSELKHSGIKATWTTHALHYRLIQYQLGDPVPEPEPESEPEPVLAPPRSQSNESSFQRANDFLSIFPPKLEPGAAPETTAEAELASGNPDATAQDIPDPAASLTVSPTSCRSLRTPIRRPRGC